MKIRRNNKKVWRPRPKTNFFHLFLHEDEGHAKIGLLWFKSSPAVSTNSSRVLAVNDERTSRPRTCTDTVVERRTVLYISATPITIQNRPHNVGAFTRHGCWLWHKNSFSRIHRTKQTQEMPFFAPTFMPNFHFASHTEYACVLRLAQGKAVRIKSHEAPATVTLHLCCSYTSASLAPLVVLECS